MASKTYVFSRNPVGFREVSKSEKWHLGFEFFVRLPEVCIFYEGLGWYQEEVMSQCSKAAGPLGRPTHDTLKKRQVVVLFSAKLTYSKCV